MLPGDRVHREARRAASNCCQSTKRSLLDYLDYIMETYLESVTDPVAKRRLVRVLQILKKRVHNDLSMLNSQTAAILELVQAGGNIPPFGHEDGAPMAPPSTDEPEAATGLVVQPGPGGVAELVPVSALEQAGRLTADGGVIPESTSPPHQRIYATLQTGAGVYPIETVTAFNGPRVRVSR
jgi:hypothetical protein